MAGAAQSASYFNRRDSSLWNRLETALPQAAIRSTLQICSYWSSQFSLASPVHFIFLFLASQRVKARRVAQEPPESAILTFQRPMIKLRKWNDSSDVNMVVLAEGLEQLLLAVYEISPWTAETSRRVHAPVGRDSLCAGRR